MLGRSMVSIIICTRNRAESLKRTLESVCESAPSWQISWELLVIDNGSTDHTRTVVTEFLENSSYDLQYHHEPRTGKSYALNLGIFHAKGEIILFTDDDALVTPQWLPAMVQAFHENGAIGIICGRTEPFDPSQARQSVRTSREPKEYRWPVSSDFIVGNNMGIPSSVLRIVGEFDVHLGPGARAGYAEDTDMAYRILKSGFPGKYDPDVLVYHDHRREGEKVEEVRWNYAKGRGAFMLKHILRGDLFALKIAYWNTKSIIKNRNHPDPFFCVKDWKRILFAECVGAITWLARL